MSQVSDHNISWWLFKSWFSSPGRLITPGVVSSESDLTSTSPSKRVSVVIILPDGSLLRLPEETSSICRLYTNPRAAATKKVWFPPLKRDTLLFCVLCTLLAGDTLQLHAVVPVLHGVQAGLGHLGPGAGHGGADMRHVPRVMVPRVPVSRDTRPLHLTLCCHAPPRGIVYWLVSNQKPGLARRLVIICTGKDSQMLHNRPWHWTWQSCYGANPLHCGFIPWLQGVTGYCICQPREASQVFDTYSRVRSYVHFITIWSVVKSHRCVAMVTVRGAAHNWAWLHVTGASW